MTLPTKALLLAGALVSVGSCSNDSGPVAGVLTVSLATPNPPGGDGAILLTVTGPSALTGVTATSGLRVFVQPLSTATKIAVTGTLGTGAILTVGVTDVRQVAQYKATIQTIAANDFQLRSLAGYSLTVSK
jgi:hypothetical protein